MSFLRMDKINYNYMFSTIIPSDYDVVIVLYNRLKYIFSGNTYIMNCKTTFPTYRHYKPIHSYNPYFHPVWYTYIRT